MAHRSLSQPVDVVRRRRRKAALDDHPLPIAHPPVTGRTINIEAFSAALNIPPGNGKWKGRHRLAPDFAGVEVLVDSQMASRDRAGNNRTGRPAIVEEGAFVERFVSRLHVHVGAASG
jgi:hypothetical protein